MARLFHPDLFDLPVFPDEDAGSDLQAALPLRYHDGALEDGDSALTATVLARRPVIDDPKSDPAPSSGSSSNPSKPKTSPSGGSSSDGSSSGGSSKPKKKRDPSEPAKEPAPSASKNPKDPGSNRKKNKDVQPSDDPPAADSKGGKTKDPVRPRNPDPDGDDSETTDPQSGGSQSAGKAPADGKSPKDGDPSPPSSSESEASGPSSPPKPKTKDTPPPSHTIPPDPAGSDDSASLPDGGIGGDPDDLTGDDPETMNGEPAVSEDVSTIEASLAVPDSAPGLPPDYLGQRDIETALGREPDTLCCASTIVNAVQTRYPDLDRQALIDAVGAAADTPLAGGGEPCVSADGRVNSVYQYSQALSRQLGLEEYVDTPGQYATVAEAQEAGAAMMKVELSGTIDHRPAEHHVLRIGDLVIDPYSEAGIDEVFDAGSKKVENVMALDWYAVP